MNTFEQLAKQFHFIESKLGYSFKDPSLLTLAFIHRSFANENRDVSEHNERLEFLGDSVLNLIISDYLYRMLPHIPEGELSALRSRLVDAPSCTHYIKSLSIDSFLLLGKGERLNDGRGRESILADLFEAVIGAIYLDGGLEPVQMFLFRNFSTHFEKIFETPSHNWKALLQDFCQKKFQQTPQYKVMEESGPDHSKQFVIAVTIEQKEMGRGKGSSKKEAQQAAAAAAYSLFEVE